MQHSSGKKRKSSLWALESKQEVLFAAATCVIFLVIVLSASIRHSVLCESGLDEETEARSQLARQSLEARLLNVEQEAMENSIVIERLLSLIKEKTSESRDEHLEFARIYADAEKLALEIDAAFYRVDDDFLSKDQSAEKSAIGLRVDNQPGFQQRLPFDSMSPQIEARLPHNDRHQFNAHDVDTHARCEYLASTHGIVPEMSWGAAPVETQLEWRNLECDLHVSSGG